MIGIERFAGLEHAEAQMQQLAHRGSDDLLGLEPALVPQTLAQGGHQRVPAERGEGGKIERRTQSGVADPGDPGRRVERGARLPMARIETGIGRRLPRRAQHRRPRQLAQDHGGRVRRDAGNRNQQIVPGLL